MKEGPIDKILRFGSYFDWFSPLLAQVQDIANGPSFTFLIPELCGRSANSIDRLLKQHGVKTWGKMIVNGDIMITVRKQQARWAQYLLDREGIRYRNGGVPNGHVPTGHSPTEPSKQQSRPSDWKEELIGLFDM